MLVPGDEPERGISPLYSCGKIHIRLLCNAALTIVLQKTTLPDRLNFQPPSFRMKWQMLSAPWSPGLRRFGDVIIPSGMPSPTSCYRCARWDASEGTAFGDLLLGVVSASQLGQHLRANVHTKIARMEAAKLPVMNTYEKRVGGYPLLLSAFGSASGAWIRLPRRAGARALKVRLFDSEELDVKDKCGVGRDDSAGAAISVSKVRRNSQLPLAAYFHSRYSLIPSLDYLSGSELKHEWLAPIDRAIEFLAIFCQPTGVMHTHGFSGGGSGSRALFEIPILQPGRSGLALSGHFRWAGIIRLSPAADGGEKCKKNKRANVLSFHGVLPKSGIIYHPHRFDLKFETDLWAPDEDR
jgi:hypothetical protein